MEPEAITLLCTQARALSCLDDVEMYLKNAGIRRTMESLLNSLAVIAQTKETLKLSLPTPALEALITELEVKMVNLRRDHAEATLLESLASIELGALAEHFHYVKAEYMHLWNRMNACYTIQEDNKGATKHKEHLIAQPKLFWLQSRRVVMMKPTLNKWLNELMPKPPFNNKLPSLKNSTTRLKLSSNFLYC